MKSSIDIDLDPDDLKLVLQILNDVIPDYEVWAFGSRVKHTAKKFSDLDLVVITQKPLSLALLSKLKETFSESDLPIKVDVLDWSRIDADFQELIRSKYLTLKTRLLYK